MLFHRKENILMLIFSKERLTPPHINMITLKDADNNYYYVHRSLYDQSVILYDVYHERVSSLDTAISGTGHKAGADFFLSRAPAPINILGRFLSLIEGEPPADDIEVLCGAIHVMSTSLDFRKMLKLDVNLRRSARFSLSIKEEYTILWERFFQECRIAEQTIHIVQENQNLHTEEIKENNFLSAMWEEIDGEPEPETKEQQTLPKEETVTEEKTTQPVKSGLELLKGYGKKNGH
jgi:hypothetical protein